MTLLDWETLRAGAVIGTGRRPLDLVEVAGHACGSGELALLRGAALLGTERRAGLQLPVDGRRSEPAPTDDRTAATAGAVGLLEVLIGEAALSGPPDDLLRHWVRECAAAGYRIPHSHLVRLLDHQSVFVDADVETTAAAASVVGERGRWLVTQRPDRWTAWPALLATGDAEPTGDTEKWENLDADRRRSAILRLADAEPGRARALIASEWDNQKAAGRVELLLALESRLSAEDEAFLERALDDRATSVRSTAQRLLVRLPASRRAGRAAELLEGMISQKRRFSRSIELADPPPATEDDLRWGLADPDRPNSAARFTARIIAAAPLRVWTDAGHRPVAVVHALSEPDHRGALVAATVAQRNVEFAELLLDEPDPGIPSLLPPERLLWTIDHLPSNTPPTTLARLVVALPAPWSESVARTVGKTIRSMKDPTAHARTAADAIRAGGSATIIPDLDALLAKVQKATADERGAARDERALRRLITHLSTRHSITEAFR